MLDTSVVIDLHLVDPAVLPRWPAITTVTIAELSVGPLLARTDEERSTRQLHLQLAESAFDPLPFDVDAARAFATVSMSLRRAGRKPAARTFDAMIAAIALARQLPLYTANAADLRGVEGLQLVEVER